MSGPMSVSMTIKVVDEASAAVQGITGAVRELKAAEQGIGTATGERSEAWAEEKSAVQGVVAEVRTLGTLRQDTGSITAATSAYREQAEAVESARASGERFVDVVKRRAEAEREARRTIRAAADEAARSSEDASAIRGSSGDLDPSHPAFGLSPRVPPAGRRATEWVAEQEAIRQMGEEAGRASDRIEDLHTGLARLGLAGMAFGDVRRIGEDIQRPIEAADDLWTDFQAKTQDLASRSEDNGGQRARGEHILSVAREANVPWQQVYEGEQSLVSFGGGKQLSAMAAFETRMNKLALAGNIKAEDVYSSMMHYIKGGLSAADAMDVLEQQHVQGQRGAVELNQLTRYMPSLMALGREFGMTPKQAALDTSALMQIARENVGTPGEAATLVREGMTKLSDPRTVRRLEADLGIDDFQVRASAKARGANPMLSLLDVIADKFNALSPEQKGTLRTDGEGHGYVSGGDPKIMGDLARDYRFRAMLDAYIQHRSELPEFNVDVGEARKNTDESYAAQNSTVRQAKQKAANSKAEAEIRAGETQTGVMKMTAGAASGAWDAGGWFARHFPGITGAAGAGSDALGTVFKGLGQIGETAIGVATAVKSAQYLGGRFPALGEAGGVVRSALTAPFDAVSGVVGGLVDGVREAKAEVAAQGATATGATNPLKATPEPSASSPSVTGSLAEAATEAASAAMKFSEASTSLGTLGLLAALASKSDMGINPERAARMEREGLLAPGNSPIRLPGEPGYVARASAAVPEGASERNSTIMAVTEAIREQARRSVDEFRRDPEAARGRAMEQAGGPFARVRTAADPPPQQVTNNVTTPITVNAPVTVNATVNNTTPGAIANTVAGAIHAAVGAGRGAARGSNGALHDGPETK